jgi:hypothetical protein
VPRNKALIWLAIFFLLELGEWNLLLHKGFMDNVRKHNNDVVHQYLMSYHGVNDVVPFACTTSGCDSRKELLRGISQPVIRE